MKKLSIAFLTVLMLIFAFSATACGDPGDGDTYQIKFMVDGTIWQNGPIKTGELISMPSEPSKPDHVFDGWYYDEGTWERPFSLTELSGTEITGNITVYAKFTYQHTHDWSTHSNNDGTHTKSCLIDSSHTETEACSGGTASCESPAICSVCHVEYGEKLEHEYENEECIHCHKPEFSAGLLFNPILSGSAYEVSIGSCTDFDVSIPPTYNGRPVIAIADYGFSECNLIDSLKIPSSIRIIGAYAFKFCDFELIWDSCPQNTVIGEYAFSSFGVCDIVLPEGVKSIGEHAFDPSGVTSVTIPDSVTSIGEYAFSYCEAEIIWGDNPSILEIAAHTFEVYCGTSLTIPDSVMTIGDFAFCRSKIENITMSESLMSIGESAFWECYDLTGTVKLANGVTSIGEFAFGCISAEIVWGDDPEITEIGEFAFTGYLGTSLTIPGSVTTISTGAFSSCVNLTTLTIPKSVTSITGGPFSVITAELIWEEGTEITTIGSDGLAGYLGTSLTIPSTVTTLANAALANCTNLTALTIPSGVTSIGEYAFSGTSAAINWGANPQITTIGHYAFYEYLGDSIVIPSSVTSLGYGAFSECPNLKNVSLPANFKTMDNHVFANCTALENITLPQNLETIGSSVFEGCTSLKSIVIPNKVTEMYGSAFKYCTALKTVTLGTKLEYIGENAFEGCTALTGITIPNNVINLGMYAFKDCTALKTATLSNKLGTEVANEGIFFGCTALTSVTIPEGAKQLGSKMFEGCTALRSVTIPTSVINIHSEAFKGCTALTKLIIPEGVERIYENAVVDCPALTVYCEAAVSGQEWNIGWCTTSPVVWNCKNNEVATDGYIYTVINGIRYGIKDECATVMKQPSYVTTAIVPVNITYGGTEYLVKYVAARAFDSVTGFEALYYEGTKEDSHTFNISSPNDVLTPDKIYIYVENEIDLPDDDGNYWHYVGGNPTVWEKEN